MSFQHHWIEDLLEKMERKFRVEAERLGTRIPYISIQGRYDDMGEKNIAWWTNSFWAGILWQLRHATQDGMYEAAATASEERLEEMFAYPDTWDHDIGFLGLLTSVARYRATGDRTAQERGLRDADILMSRFCENGRYIKAWNPPAPSCMIIDCLMNLPLLFWATNITGRPEYREVAEAHLETASRYLLRDDGSCNHIAEFDGDGRLVNLPGGQGYGPGSSWSRGQAWSLYGFALAYRHTGNPEHLSRSKLAAHYFISAVRATGYVSRIDFRAPDQPIYIDTTATACAASGLLELAGHVPEFEKHLYRDAAYEMLQALAQDFLDLDPSTDGILQKGSARYNRESDREVHIIYGDYFLLEAVLRFLGQDAFLW